MHEQRVVEERDLRAALEKYECSIRCIAKDQEVIVSMLGEIRCGQQLIIQNQESLKMAIAAVQEYARRIDVATNGIAAKLQKLRDQIAAGSITPQQIADALEPVVNSLEVMSHDADNPLPA